MDFFLLVLVVAFLAGVYGIFQEISQIIGPVLLLSGIIIGITLIVSFINRRK